MSDQMTELLAGVVGIIDAASFEQHMLWADNSRREQPLTWKENMSGLTAIVGLLGEMPVCISLFTAEIDGHKLLFWHATSQVVDYRMIDKWMIENLPKSAFHADGRVNQTDAGNFHNIFPRTTQTPAPGVVRETGDL